MKKYTLLAFSLLAFAASGLTARAQSAEFAIKKVDVEFVPTPDYQVNPNPMRPVGPPQKWAKIDVTFEAVPEMTPELTLNYYVLLMDRLLVGRVTHVNVVRGRELHSVLFISPRSLDMLTQGSKSLTKTSFGNISVTISGAGANAGMAVGHLKPGARGEWWALPTYKQEEGFLVNKSETPFAPLGWDYYEAVKPASAR